MQRKKGVSLIVLVITIIVMIILASAVILSLSSAGIIGKAQEAVDKTNLKTVQQLASTLWADAYMNGKTEQTELKEAVINGLTAQGINTSDYKITVTTKGVKVEDTVQAATSTLGSLVASAENYGDTVNYTVTVNEGTEKETTIDDWKVLYKQTVQDKTTGKSEEYVYLIASEKLAANAIPTKLADPVDEGGAGATINGQDIYWAEPTTAASGTINKDLWLANWNNGVYTTNTNAKCVSYFLAETYWTAFKNDTDYKDASGNSYVVGAIGTPTAEMFVASWNAKREATGDTTTYNKKLSLVTKGTTGYYVNDVTESDPASSDTTYQNIATTDDLYIWSTTSGASCWLASPSGVNPISLLRARYDGSVGADDFGITYNGARPVVCVKSSIPARAGTTADATDIVLE